MDLRGTTSGLWEIASLAQHFRWEKSRSPHACCFKLSFGLVAPPCLIYIICMNDSRLWKTAKWSKNAILKSTKQPRKRATTAPSVFHPLDEGMIFGALQFPFFVFGSALHCKHRICFYLCHAAPVELGAWLRNVILRLVAGGAIKSTLKNRRALI